MRDSPLGKKWWGMIGSQALCYPAQELLRLGSSLHGLCSIQAQQWTWRVTSSIRSGRAGWWDESPPPPEKHREVQTLPTGHCLFGLPGAAGRWSGCLAHHRAPGQPRCPWPASQYHMGKGAFGGTGEWQKTPHLPEFQADHHLPETCSWEYLCCAACCFAGLS